MNHTHFTRLLLASVATGAVLASPLPHANATEGAYVENRIAWGPSPCVVVNEPDPGTWRNSLLTHTVCGGGYASSNYFVPVGSLFGIDPVMGDNQFISCTVTDTRTGLALYTDFGTKGDGHDINCLRTLTSGSVVI